MYVRLDPCLILNTGKIPDGSKTYRYQRCVPFETLNGVGRIDFLTHTQNPEAKNKRRLVSLMMKRTSP